MIPPQKRLLYIPVIFSNDSFISTSDFFTRFTYFHEMLFTFVLPVILSHHSYCFVFHMMNFHVILFTWFIHLFYGNRFQTWPPPPHTHTKWFICFDLWFFSHDLWDFLTRISLFLRRNIFTFSRSVINLWGKIKHALEQHRSISPRV